MPPLELTIVEGAMIVECGATWNLEWEKPGTPRHRAALAHIESVGADVVVTTEDSVHEWDAYPYRVDGGADWGYPPVEGRRKVIPWSRSPWVDAEVVDDGAMRGRFVIATTSVGGLDLRVLAVCIPWLDAHVRTGRRIGEIWAGHVEFCKRLGEVIRSIDGPFVVAGDFNQRVPRRRQPSACLRRADGCARRCHVAAAGEFDVGRLIDHVASSANLTATTVTTWSNVIDGRRISDHSGVAVDFQDVMKPTNEERLRYWSTTLAKQSECDSTV